MKGILFHRKPDSKKHYILISSICLLALVAAGGLSCIREAVYNEEKKKLAKT